MRYPNVKAASVTMTARSLQTELYVSPTSVKPDGMARTAASVVVM